jgi:hypothetical protein
MLCKRPVKVVYIPALRLARDAESPWHRAFVHSRSTDRELPWQPMLLTEPMSMVARTQLQYMKLPMVRNDATKALKADSATAAFCSLYMLTAAASLGVLQV